MDRVILAFSNQSSHACIRELLASRGLCPEASFFCGASVIGAVRKLGTAVVISGSHLQDMPASKLAAALRSRAEIMVIADQSSNYYCRSGSNLYFLSSPISPGKFFALLEQLHQKESMQLRPAMEQRMEQELDIINRAKALLIRSNHLMEDEAHRYLQKKSMFMGLPMVKVAQIFLDQFSA